MVLASAIHPRCAHLISSRANVIPGGSDQVGRVLARHYHARGDVVVILGRTPSGTDDPIARTLAWDAKTLGPWAKELDGADLVINLAGSGSSAFENT